MEQVATVTSKSMVTIPAKFMEKYGLRQGAKLVFVDTDEGILLFPLVSLRELRGAFKKNEKAVREGIRELTREHRREASGS